MVNSLRTADVSPRSSLLRHISQRLTSLSGDERFAGYTTRLVFGVLLAREQAPDWGWGGDGREKIGERSEPRIVVWGGG